MSECVLKECSAANLCKECNVKFNDNMSNIANFPKIGKKLNILNEINYPSSLVDLMKVEKEMKNCKFHVFEIIDNFCKKIYSTKIVDNREIKYIIPLVRIHLSESQFHWSYIHDLSLFLKKSYYNLDNSSSVNKSLMCSYCLSHICAQDNTIINEKDIKLEIKEILPFIKDKKFLKSKYIDHLNLCRCNNLTNRIIENEKYLKFKKHYANQEKRYSGFLDFETFNSFEESKVCNFCEEKLGKVYSNSKRNDIIEKCVNENHTKVSKCKNCYLKFKSLASKSRKECCSLNPKHNGYFLCVECENEVKEILEENKCNHPFVSKSNQLLPLSLGFCLVEHLPEKISLMKSIKNKKKMGPIEKYLN